MKTMRIAIIAGFRDISLPMIDFDGGPVAIRNYALELGKLGHTVDVYVSRVSSQDGFNDYLRGKALAQSGAKVKLAKNVTVFRRYSRYVNERASRLPRSEMLMIDSMQFGSAFSKSDLADYDVICSFHVLNIAGLLAKGVVPVERTVIFPMQLFSEYSKYQDMSKAYQEMEAAAIKRAAFISTPSSQEQSELVAMGVPAERIVKISRGYSDEVFSFVKKKAITGKIMIVVPGAIRRQKQTHLLVEIAHILRSQNIDFHIFVAGENRKFYADDHERYFREIEQKIASLDLAEYITFTGVLSPTELSALLKRSHIALFPSLSESFGKAALEAIASGTPTILSKNVAAYREFASNGKNALAVSGTAMSYVNAIKKLRKDAALYVALSQSGKMLAERFSWRAVTRELSDFLVEKFGRRTPSRSLESRRLPELTQA